jgi:plasmid stability protein
MCQMCDEYEAELRRMGIAMDEKVTVDLDEELMSALAREAQSHGHDIASEIRDIVREKVSGPAPSPIDFVDEFRRIRAMTPRGVPQTDSTRIIRDSRDHDH